MPTLLQFTWIFAIASLSTASVNVAFGFGKKPATPYYGQIRISFLECDDPRYLDSKCTPRPFQGTLSLDQWDEASQTTSRSTQDINASQVTVFFRSTPYSDSDSKLIWEPSGLLYREYPLSDLRTLEIFDSSGAILGTDAVFKDRFAKILAEYSGGDLGMSIRFSRDGKVLPLFNISSRGNSWSENRSSPLYYAPSLENSDLDALKKMGQILEEKEGMIESPQAYVSALYSLAAHLVQKEDRSLSIFATRAYLNLIEEKNLGLRPQPLESVLLLLLQKTKFETFQDYALFLSLRPGRPFFSARLLREMTTEEMIDAVPAPTSSELLLIAKELGRGSFGEKRANALARLLERKLLKDELLIPLEELLTTTAQISLSDERQMDLNHHLARFVLNYRIISDLNELARIIPILWINQKDPEKSNRGYSQLAFPLDTRSTEFHFLMKSALFDYPKLRTVSAFHESIFKRFFYWDSAGYTWRQGYQVRSDANPSQDNRSEVLQFWSAYLQARKTPLTQEEIFTLTTEGILTETQPAFLRWVFENTELSRMQVLSTFAHSAKSIHSRIFQSNDLDRISATLLEFQKDPARADDFKAFYNEACSPAKIFQNQTLCVLLRQH